jgi:soluble lytic murein transglycosylase-like protein
MGRRFFCALLCLLVPTLSCDILRSTPAQRASDSLALSAQETTRPKTDPALASALAYFRSKRSGLTEAEIERVATVTVREARRHQLDPGLVMAVIHIESRGNTFARSPVGAMGLMQVMPATGEELAAELELPWPGPHALFDPVLNVRLGTAYLKQLHERFGSTRTALAAYNAGPGRIDRRLRRGAALPASYSDSVLAAYDAPPTQRNRPVAPVSYQY